MSIKIITIRLIINGEIKMFKFLTKKKKESSSNLDIDYITKRVLKLKRHVAQQKLKIWQQSHLV
jgi:hypothetical protein